MEGEGHKPSAHQEHREPPRIFQNILPQVIRNHTVGTLPQSSSSVNHCFSFHFSSSFFFFFHFSNHICFSIIESAHTDFALAFKHAVLTETCKQLLPPTASCLGDTGKSSGGEKKREVFQNLTQDLRNTEFMQLAPGHRSSGSSSC